ncbi:MAG TPA: Rne/Rng family ribonuclease [Ilumatobacter sp.]|nr:Rne/Rng family ribonuclease [Ilumatobacter sp.]
MDDSNMSAGGPTEPATPAAAAGAEAGQRSDGEDTAGGSSAVKRRRRGSRGGQNRKRPDDAADVTLDDAAISAQPDELPEPIREGRVTDPEAADKALVRKPKVGDTRAPFVPAMPPPGPAVVGKAATGARNGSSTAKSAGGSRKRRRGVGRSEIDAAATGASAASIGSPDTAQPDGQRKRRRGGRPKPAAVPVDADLFEQRRGRERNGRPIGRFFMCVQVRSGMAQVAVLEGRSLIEHYVSRPADDISQIHGNIYLGRVQNVLPGMEAAFVDIATPKNAVLYRGDVQYDQEDILDKGKSDKNTRIEDILRPRQMIMCQVTKNPIGAKGARLTQEVSLPGRFVVLIPNSRTYGISKRLPDDTRKRLRNILDRVKPEEHGLIVRTAAEHATVADLEADMRLLLDQWTEIERKASKATKPGLLYREPELAVRVIREEFNPDYRGVVIDDEALYEQVRAYVMAFNPELADRIEHYEAEAEGLPLFERFHVHEQVHKALDRKVWLPSGGSLIIEHTEALTVIDVNTGKNVGKSNLEETVFHNNMEAADEIAKQLRLRDIGGIIVIDFIDMEIKANRAAVVAAFRDALARDKTRTQVFDISELGLVEMTRKRIGEGLLTEFSEICPNCEGRGVLVDHSLLE